MLRAVVAVMLIVLPLFAQDPTDAQTAWLDIELNSTTQTVSGDVTWTMKSQVNGLTSLTLQLASGFTVSNARSGGLSTTFTRPTDAIVIALDRPYNQNEIFTVAVHYTGSPTAGAGFGSFAFSSHGSPSTAAIWSLSEPYYAYTWWPCKESLTDKFLSTTWVTVPSTLSVASNGLLQGTDALSGSRTRYRWSTNYPMATYAVSVAATNYTPRTDTYTGLGANMPIQFYAYPESFASSQTDMNRLSVMIQTYSNLVGQYPFVNEKYGICQFGWGGGMEHQTMTSQINFGENLSSHELGHTWWGNCVTCATWHDIGVNEGFATYMEALWDEFKPGGGVSSYFARMNSNKPSGPTSSGSVWVTDISNNNTIFSTNNVYRKGAWVLHQLRHIVGDTTFFQIMRDYRTAHEYSSATWQDFAASASQTYGHDLTWYINQAVMRTGAPAYSLAWTNRSIGGQNYVVGNIRQTQTASPFRFPIDIRVTTPSGQTTTPVWNDQVRDDFILPANGTASLVELDPSPWILRGTNTTGTYAASLTASPTTIPRTGGTVTFSLAGSTTNANRPYIVGASATGVSPGVALPDGKVIPLMLDVVTDFVFQNTNTPLFANFAGVLNASGAATAQFVMPDIGPIPGPITLYFGFATTTSPTFTSNPVSITIIP